MAEGNAAPPSRMRLVVSLVLVLILVWAVWKVIDYRQKPPPPPNKIGEMVR
ncbi:MAG TPA: hypothetical protein VGF73_00940 [Chthoniobacterales bacterium]